jgi:outer membrane biosynthesis protein TonB
VTLSQQERGVFRHLLDKLLGAGGDEPEAAAAPMPLEAPEPGTGGNSGNSEEPAEEPAEELEPDAEAIRAARREPAEEATAQPVAPEPAEEPEPEPAEEPEPEPAKEPEPEELEEPAPAEPEPDAEAIRAERQRPPAPPTSAPTVSSSGEPAPLSPQQRGFLAASAEAVASVAGALGQGTIVAYEGGFAVVLEPVTHVDDAGELVGLERPKYRLGLFARITDPVEL